MSLLIIDVRSSRYGYSSLINAISKNCRPSWQDLNLANPTYPCFEEQLALINIKQHQSELENRNRKKKKIEAKDQTRFEGRAFPAKAWRPYPFLEEQLTLIRARTVGAGE